MGDLKLGVQLGYWQRDPHANFVAIEPFRREVA
jgi:hypothetical protein